MAGLMISIRERIGDVKGYPHDALGKLDILIAKYGNDDKYEMNIKGIKIQNIKENCLRTFVNRGLVIHSGIVNIGLTGVIGSIQDTNGSPMIAELVRTGFSSTGNHTWPRNPTKSKAHRREERPETAAKTSPSVMLTKAPIRITKDTATSYYNHVPVLPTLDREPYIVRESTPVAAPEPPANRVTPQLRHENAPVAAPEPPAKRATPQLRHEAAEFVHTPRVQQTQNIEPTPMPVPTYEQPPPPFTPMRPPCQPIYNNYNEYQNPHNDPYQYVNPNLVDNPYIANNDYNNDQEQHHVYEEPSFIEARDTYTPSASYHSLHHQMPPHQFQMPPNLQHMPPNLQNMPPNYQQQMPPNYQQQMPPNYQQQMPPNYQQQMPPNYQQQMPHQMPHYNQYQMPPHNDLMPPYYNQMPPQHHYQMPPYQDLMPPYYNQMPPQYHNQMPPQHHNQMPPQNHDQMPPQHHHQMPPQNHDQMPPQHHHQMPPQNHDQMPPQHHHQMPPQNHHQMPPQSQQYMPPRYQHHMPPQYQQQMPPHHQMPAYPLFRQQFLYQRYPLPMFLYERTGPHVYLPGELRPNKSNAYPYSRELEVYYDCSLCMPMFDAQLEHSLYLAYFSGIYPYPFSQFKMLYKTHMISEILDNAQ